ncbi:hypothetical protein BJQ96_00248 [Flavobacterium sp. PL0002]|nr:hypothetical protein [Flavobacterium sp. PL002]
MQESFNEILKLLLPEIIINYFELTSYKKERSSPSLSKRD